MTGVLCFKICEYKKASFSAQNKKLFYYFFVYRVFICKNTFLSTISINKLSFLNFRFIYSIENETTVFSRPKTNLSDCCFGCDFVYNKQANLSSNFFFDYSLQQNFQLYFHHLHYFFFFFVMRYCFISLTFFYLGRITPSKLKKKYISYLQKPIHTLFLHIKKNSHSLRF